MQYGEEMLSSALTVLLQMTMVLTASWSSQILLMAHPLLHSNVEAIFRHLLTTLTWIHTALRVLACVLHFCFVWLLLADHPQGPWTHITPQLHFVLENKSVAVDDLEWTFGNDTSVYDYLKSDYDILQGIQHEIANLAITWSVICVKGPQDCHKPRTMLSIEALANCYADDICTDTHHCHHQDVWQFPDWVPGKQATLLHQGKLVSKKQDEYVMTAATIPHLCKQLIKKSQWHNPLIPNSQWLVWWHVWWHWLEECLVTKYAHNWTPTLYQCTTQDNSIDRWCFMCSALKEDINHVLWCPCELRDAAHTKAKIQFLNHLAKVHTPAPMANVIMTALDHWFSNLPHNVVPHLPTGPNKPNCQLHWLINNAVHQNYIGWGHFLWGCLTLQWKSCIAEYYKVCQPGDAFNPSLWMQKTINAIWQNFQMIWLTQNEELHGKDNKEQCTIMTKFLGFMKKKNNMSMMQKANYSMVNHLNRFSHGQNLTWMHT